MAVISVGETTTTSEAGIGGRPGTTALSDLHSRTSNETRASDLDRSPPTHRSRRRTDRRNRRFGETAASGLNAVIPSGVPTPVGPS